MSPEPNNVVVRQLNYLNVRPLRLEVLRAGMVNKSVIFDGDDEPTTVHFGACNDAGEIIGVSTWMQRPFQLAPHLQGLQLRGMATAIKMQGLGVGALLLNAGLQYGLEIGCDLMWANARDAALNFYNRHGFSTVGEGFIESVTQLPHHVVVKYLV